MTQGETPHETTEAAAAALPRICPTRIIMQRAAETVSYPNAAGPGFPPDFLACQEECPGPQPVPVTITSRRWGIVGPKITRKSVELVCPQR